MAERGLCFPLCDRFFFFVYRTKCYDGTLIIVCSSVWGGQVVNKVFWIGTSVLTDASQWAYTEELLFISSSFSFFFKFPFALPLSCFPFCCSPNMPSQSHPAKIPAEVSLAPIRLQTGRTQASFFTCMTAYEQLLNPAAEGTFKDCVCVCEREGRRAYVYVYEEFVWEEGGIPHATSANCASCK